MSNNKQDNTLSAIRSLSNAITALAKGDNDAASVFITSALRKVLAGGSAPKKSNPNVKHAKGVVGRLPALNATQQKKFAERLASGASVASLSRDYGIAYPTAVRYARMARANAVVTTETTNA